MLNQYFKTVFTVDDDENQPHKGQSLYPTIANFEITTQGVCNHTNLQDLHFEGNCYRGVTYANSYQQSLSTGVVPTQWKHAYVTPIFKKGAKTDPTNYRPVSLTLVVCKSTEHILVSQIMQHLGIYNI